MIGKLKSIWRNQPSDVKILGKGLFWSMAGSMFSRGMLFFAWVIIARMLGKDQYGEYGLIRNTVMMFATFASAGMGQAATKFVAEFIHKDKPKAERIAALITRTGTVSACIVFVVAMAISPYIAEKTIHAPWLLNEFRVASLVLLFAVINTVQIGVLEGLGLFKKIASINTINGIVSLPLFVAGAYYGGVFGSVIAYCLSFILLCALSSWHIHKQKLAGVFTFNVKECWAERKIIIIFLLPALLSGIMVLPMKWITDVMLVNGSGFSQMGIFTAAMTINIMLNSIAVMLNSPFLNLISRNKGENNDRIEKLNIFVPWLLGIVIAFPLILFANLGGLLFGKEYAGVMFNQTFIFILIFSLISMYKQGFGRLFALHNLQWLAFLSNALWGAGLIVSFMLLKDLGAVGLAVSYCTSTIFSTAIMYPYFIKKGYISRRFVISPFVILIWAITALVVWAAMQNLGILWSIIICSTTLCITIYLFYKELKK